MPFNGGLMTKRNLLLVVFVGVLGAACSGTDTPTENDYDDVAQALGGVAATDDGGGEVGTLIDASVIATGSSADGISLHASGKFSGNRLGITYDYDVSCADSSGKPLDPCTSASDSADVSVKWSGELATAVLNASVSHDGELKLTSIQSGTVSVSGQSSLQLDARFDALLREASRTYHLSYRAEYRDLRVQRSPARMLGGSIQYALEVERTATNRTREASANFEIEAELVFGADGSATLTLDGQHHYAIDTHTGTVAKMTN
jgi:hypothetical protein